MTMYAHYKKNQGDLLDLKMPLEPIHEAPKLQVLNAKTPPALSSLANAPRLLEGRNLSVPSQEKRSNALTAVKKLATIDFKSKQDANESPLKMSSQNTYVVSDSGTSSFPTSSLLSSTKSVRSEMNQNFGQRNYTSDSSLVPAFRGKEVTETVHSVPKAQSESLTLKHQLSPLIPKKLNHRERLEPIGKVKPEIIKISHSKNLNQQKLQVDCELDYHQTDSNTVVILKGSKSSKERDCAEKNLRELKKQTPKQYVNLEHSFENRLTDKEFSTHYEEIHQKNEHNATSEISHVTDFDEASSILHQKTGLSNESGDTIKIHENDAEEYDELLTKITDFKSELNLLNGLITDKQQAYNDLEAEISALKNEKSELSTEKEQLMYDIEEEYENNKKILAEKDLLLKDIDELQVEADNIENDLDLLRIEKSKLCLELKELKNDINEKTAELKKQQDLFNMQLDRSFVKDDMISSVDKHFTSEVLYSDFECQVTIEGDSMLPNESKISLETLFDKKVGTNVLSCSAFCQVEDNFGFRKETKDQQTFTEVQYFDSSCQTENMYNVDQFVQVKPVHSVKSVNTILSKTYSFPTKDLAVQVNTRENITLDRSCQTMSVMGKTSNHISDADAKLVNPRNTLDALTNIRPEFESETNPLYEHLQFVEESVCVDLKKNITHKENVIEDVTDEPKQQVVDLEQHNPAFQIIQHFNISDQKTNSNVGQQNELLISSQGLTDTVCSPENSYVINSAEYNSPFAMNDLKSTAGLEDARSSDSYTLVEAAAIFRYLQMRSKKTKDLSCSSSNKSLTQPADQPGKYTLQATPYGNYFQSEAIPIADLEKSRTYKSSAKNDPKFTSASKNRNLLENYTLAEAAAIFHHQQIQKQKNEEISRNSINESLPQQPAAVQPNHVLQTPHNDYFQPGITPLTDVIKLPTHNASILKSDSNLSTDVEDASLTDMYKLAGAFLHTRQVKNSRKEEISQYSQKEEISQYSQKEDILNRNLPLKPVTQPNQSDTQTPPNNHYFQYRSAASADSSKSQTPSTPISDGEFKFSAAIEDSSLSEMYRLAEAFLYKRHVNNLRKKRMFNGWTKENSSSYSTTTKEENFSQTRNFQDFPLTKGYSPTDFHANANHSRQIFTTSSQEPNLAPFIEKWMDNRNRELNVLAEIRKRCRLYSKLNF